MWEIEELVIYAFINFSQHCTRRIRCRYHVMQTTTNVVSRSIARCCHQAKLMARSQSYCPSVPKVSQRYYNGFSHNVAIVTNMAGDQKQNLAGIAGASHRHHHHHHIGLMEQWHTALNNTKNKKLSCRRETARRFMSLNLLLSHSTSRKVIRNDTVE